MYIQDLKARTVPNGIWYCAHQAIVLHVTEPNKSDFVNRIMAQAATLVVNAGKQCTHKYHKPVNWHISGERLPSNLLLRSPLEYMTNLDAYNKSCKIKWLP